MECVICLNDVHRASSCATCHSMVCHECLDRQMNTTLEHRFDCGVCRQPFLPANAHKEATTDTIIDLTNFQHAGITLADASNAVRIVKVNKSDAAFAAGIARGGRIRRINGLLVKRHAHAIGLINVATKLRMSVTCEYESPPDVCVWPRVLKF